MMKTRLLEQRLPARLAKPAALAVVLLASASAPALAGPPSPTADLSVEIEGPDTVEITRPTTYVVTVTNQGQQTSGTITARVNFPLSNTSPQVFILGTVAGIDSRCTLANNVLSCSLAGLRKGWSTSFTFTYAAPVSTKTLQMTASASSSTRDPVAANNSASLVPNLVYPVRPITSANIGTRLCTGTGLTSFFECARFPSSITAFSSSLNTDQTIGLPEPGYSGRWSQNAARTSLKMEFFDTTGSVPVKVSEFNGWAINGANCFQGLTTHLSAPGYVSPYEVCLP